MKTIICYAMIVATSIVSFGLTTKSYGYAEERIEYIESSKDFCDATDAGSLCATLELGSTYSRLDVYLASNGLYNSRLSTRCSSGTLLKSGPT